MDLLYRSTRGGDKVTASAAILKGLAPDGGLYVPESIPALPGSLEELSQLTYQDLAAKVMHAFLTDFTEEEIRSCVDRAYDSKFDDRAIAPLREEDGVHYLELFHGLTIAFKDMALSILPYLMKTAAVKNGEERKILILTATSGDTGKAAMAGFADVPGTEIIVFYPKDGVSRIQELQMVTQRGDNTHVASIRGNFDDAQSAVKSIFADPKMSENADKCGYIFSSANSINIGRLVPQVVYYIYAYGQLVKSGKIKAGDEINVTVPTGNFGNILAAHYARRMGLPIGKCICASNSNKVLFDFFTSGEYDRKRDFILTSSPSMDILISSNLERLIFEICGSDEEKCAALMKDLKEKGSYTLDEGMKAGLAGFAAGHATEEENFAGIKDLYEKTGYVIDTHTGIGNVVARRYMEESGDRRPMVVASTASPYKFADSVVRAIDPKRAEGLIDFQLISVLRDISKVDEPYAIRDVKTAPIRHDTVLDKDGIADYVMSVIGYTESGS